jgi:hypothetical protein
VAYTITLSNGTLLTTIVDATVDNTTSLTLVGRNYPGYGTAIASDLVHMLENWANTTSPTSPLTGQLWYDTTTSLLNIYDGAAWNPISFDTAAPVLFYNSACPAHQQRWRIRISNSSPYIGMLVFEALDDDNTTVLNTVLALDGVNNLIKGQVIYS